MTCSRQWPPQPDPQSRGSPLSGTEESRLHRLITRVSEEAGRPISEADLMRGLLVLGDKTEAKALVDAVRYARFDAD